MSAAALLQELQTKGVTIEPAGERLRCRAPRTLWTPDLEARVRAAKQEILRVLKAGKEARVRGRDRLQVSYEPDMCWHCQGELRCHCALCGAYGKGKTWTGGKCIACKGTGYLSWETVQ
jgi:RNase P subunit RPR2